MSPHPQYFTTPSQHAQLRTPSTACHSCAEKLAVLPQEDLWRWWCNSTRGSLKSLVDSLSLDTGFQLFKALAENTGLLMWGAAWEEAESVNLKPLHSQTKAFYLCQSIFISPGLPQLGESYFLKIKIKIKTDYSYMNATSHQLVFTTRYYSLNNRDALSVASCSKKPTPLWRRNSHFRSSLWFEL